MTPLICDRHVEGLLFLFQAFQQKHNLESLRGQDDCDCPILGESKALFRSILPKNLLASDSHPLLLLINFVASSPQDRQDWISFCQCNLPDLPPLQQSMVNLLINFCENNKVPHPHPQGERISSNLPHDQNVFSDDLSETMWFFYFDALELALAKICPDNQSPDSFSYAILEKSRRLGTYRSHGT